MQTLRPGVPLGTLGIEDFFKRLRRLHSKGAENAVISIERLYSIGHHAVAKAFPGVLQAS